MYDDERLDRTIRAALTWEADRAARSQPTLGTAAGQVAERLAPEPTLRRPRIVLFPGSEEAGRRVQPILVALILLAALMAGLAVVGALSMAPPTTPIYSSVRHAYTIALPDRSWRVLERPGTWEPGAFLEANSPGVDYMEQVGPDGRVIEEVYVYLSSQRIPDFMTFEDWAAGHDRVNTLWQPCFVLQGAHQIGVVDGERARTGTYRCEDFAEGVAWSTVQTLVVHGDRAYAIYLWPAAQGDDMPPPQQLVADSDSWLARIMFNE
jgi:hypothetical protein